MRPKNSYPNALTIRRRKAEGSLTRDDNGHVDWTLDANFENHYAGFGAVQNQSGREFYYAKQTYSDLSMVVIVPSCSETRAVTGKHRILFQSRVFEVLAAYDSQERQDEVVIVCKEVRNG